jgi:hypothetical protein
MTSLPACKEVASKTGDGPQCPAGTAACFCDHFYDIS